MNQPCKCAIYCRLSKEDEEKQQPESESIQNQKSILVNYALKRGWDICGLYCDEDYSGADVRRPDFNRLLKDAEAGKFQIILCKTQSRFTRDMELVEKYIHGKFPLWGIRFVAVADNVDTDVKGNKKARQINGLINEWYLEDLSENIRMVFDHKRSQGQYIGASPVYGYRKDPEDKNRLIVDPEAAAVVRQIFQWYLEGKGKQSIAHLLNERGYDNPTMYKKKAGLPCSYSKRMGEDGLWSPLSVMRILRNELYTGVMVQGKTRKVSYKSKACVRVPEERWFRVPGTHEAIIDAETFRRVQELMQPRVRTDGLGQVHLLSGLVKCGDCGSTMAKTSNGRKGEKRVCYLRCHEGRTLCTRHSIRLDQLTDLVTQRLREHITESYRLGDLSRFAAIQKTDDQALQKELHALEKQIQRRSAALKSLYLDKASGLLDAVQFEALYRDFLAEKEKLEERQRELEKELLEAPDESHTGFAEQIQAWMKLDPVPRELLVLAVERIEIGEKEEETGRQAVRIYWKF